MLKMVNNCVAFGCTKEYCKDPKIRFHTFPFKRPEILKLWVEAIKRYNWTPSPTNRLCSNHFREDDYVRLGSVAKRLKEDAVPSIFNHPTELQKHSVPKQENNRLNEVEGELIPKRRRAKNQANDYKCCTKKQPYNKGHKVKTLKQKV